MGSGKNRVTCNLRSVRKAKGLSQSQLAESVGVKRQAIYDIETGRYVPNTTLALQMAQRLGCKVEDLFVLEQSQEELPVTLVEKADTKNTRVTMVRVGESLIAYPLEGKRMLRDGFCAADGLLLNDGACVRLFRQREILDKRILLFGCDPAFAILSAHASRWPADAEIQCRFASSQLAMERLAAGHAHVAGTHLHNPGRGESNLALAEKNLEGIKAMVVAFSFFEEGLMVAAGNPHKIQCVADLARENIRFVNREPGAALRILLDDHLAQAGLSGESIRGYNHLAWTHDQCAQMVALNIVDAALGLRAVAAAYGLDLVPIEAVRCDLVIPCDFLDLPAVKILQDVLQTRALREELRSLPGYESSCTGKVIGLVS